MCSIFLSSCQSLCTGSHGPLVRINIHTHPNGLERVNGSHGTLSCNSRGPGVCIVGMSSDSELTDGVFPEPGDLSGSNWAQGFFTVNRGNSTTIEIGFRLESSVVIGEVQLSLLNCPARGIGAPNITLYGLMQPNMQPYMLPFTIPEFDINMAIQVGSITVPESITCPVQIWSIPNSLEDPQNFTDYFLVFNYETNSTLSWVFLIEVQFFEPPPPSTAVPCSTPTPTSTSITSSSNDTPFLETTSVGPDQETSSPPAATPVNEAPETETEGDSSDCCSS